MKAALAACVLCVGCYDTDPLYCQMHGSDTAHCSMGSGSGSGSAANACYSIQSLSLDECPVTPPPGAISITQNTTFDTGTGVSSPAGLACEMLANASSGVCVIAGTTVTIAQGATLSVTGPKPLVLAAVTKIEVSGTLDVASHGGGSIGPNADAPGCMTGLNAPGGGGGAGGSFGEAGGGGGNDNQPSGQAATAGPVLSATSLRGGCPGGEGYGFSTASGGHGGGAVALLAQMIAIAGTVDASGAGGDAGAAGGGGGGGTGGMVALSATTISISGTVFANGGGGGGGAGTSGGGRGGDPTSATMGGAAGTPGSGGGGAGGAGYPMTASGTDGTQNYDAGGGGGGGAGMIVTAGSLQSNGSVSPPPR